MTDRKNSSLLCYKPKTAPKMKYDKYNLKTSRWKGEE